MGSFIKTNSRGEYGGASVVINTNQDNAGDAGIEVDDSESGAPVEKLRLMLNSMLSLSLYAWAEAEDIDVELRRVEGYSADGSEVLGEVVAVQTITAASAGNDVQESEIVQLYSDVIRAGTYVVLANRSGATDPGRLHLYGIAKG